MIFHNPWGFLAFLSVPVIILLHFFRQSRRVQRIGGLHLWEFAAVRRPAGKKLERLIKNLSLLFQILAAILLTLLIAGIDIPETSSLHHYTIIVDDSVSMQAGKNETAVDRAKELLEEVAHRGDRYTLIAAGMEPKVLAGPFAPADEFNRAVNEWNPGSASCKVEKAVNFTVKFASDSERVLFITDNPDPAQEYEEILLVHSVGEKSPNSAILFADRVRISQNSDKIFVSLQSFSENPATIGFTAAVDDSVIFEDEISLRANEVTRISFETDVTDKDINLSLEDDILDVDNQALLRPVPIKTVVILMDGFGDITESFQKAVNAIPYTQMTTDASKAHLAFTTNQNFTPAGNNKRIFVFPPESSVMDENDFSLTAGRDIIIDQSRAITRGLSLEGVLWPYRIEETQVYYEPLLAETESALLYAETKNDDWEKYRVNLLWDKTNIYRQPAWPVLMHGIVEDCRMSIPGLHRSNFRSGEEVIVSMQNPEKKDSDFILVKDGEKVTEYNSPPEVLRDLSPGNYEIQTGQGEQIAKFTINLFSAAESDLTVMKTQEADLDRLTVSEVTRTRRNIPLFYGLLILIIGCTATSWLLRDI